jgi:phage-related protein
MAAAEIVAFLRANTDDFTAKLGAAKAEVDGLSKQGSSNLSKLGAIGKAAFLGIGAAAVAVGVAAVDFGDKQEKAQAQLQAALKASGESWDKVKGSVGDAGQAATKYGFTQAQVDSALASGVISTQSYTKAHRELGVAIELAAAKHIDLQTAMVSVEKAANGQLRPLKQLGIDLPVATGGAEKLKKANDALASAQAGLNLLLLSGAENAPKNSKSYAAYEGALAKVAYAQQNVNDVSNTGNTILEALQQRMAGQASAAANTLDGRMAALRAQSENVAASIGLKLVPVLERLLGAVSGEVTWLDRHRAAAIALASVIGGVLAVAMGVYAVLLVGKFVKSTGEAIKMLKLMRTAMADLGPSQFTLARSILGVAATYAKAAAAMLADMAVWVADTIASVATTVGANIAGAAATAAAWIAANIAMIAATGGIILAIGALVVGAYMLVTHWNDVRNFFVGLWHDVMEAFHNPIVAIVGIYVEPFIALPLIIISHWNDVEAAFKVIWAAVSDAVKTAWGILKPIFDFIINYYTALITTAITVLKTAFQVGWTLISTVVQTAWGILKPIFDFVVSYLVGTIVGAVNTLLGVWNTVWNAVGTVVSGVWNNVILPVWNGLKAGADAIAQGISAVSSAFQAAWSAVSSSVESAWNTIRPIFDAIKTAAHDVSSAIGAVTGAAGGVISGIGHVLGLATGGLVTQPTLAVVGEAGPEYVIPASMLRGANTDASGVSPLPGFGGGTATAGTTSAVAQVSVSIDGQTFLQAIQPALIQWQRANNAPTFGTPGVVANA